MPDETPLQERPRTPAVADAEWDVFRYDAHLTFNLPHKWQTVGIIEGQIAGEPLIPGEQFGVGGVSSVRGFEERGVTGDSGQRLSFELWAPPLPYEVRVLAFIDAGHVVRRHALIGEVEDDVIASTGFGLRWQWRQHVALALDYGHEIIDAHARDMIGIFPEITTGPEQGPDGEQQRQYRNNTPAPQAAL